MKKFQSVHKCSCFSGLLSEDGRMVSARLQEFNRLLFVSLPLMMVFSKKTSSLFPLEREAGHDTAIEKGRVFVGWLGRALQATCSHFVFRVVGQRQDIG
jgi:hypothetical protein